MTGATLSRDAELIAEQFRAGRQAAASRARAAQRPASGTKRYRLGLALDWKIENLCRVVMPSAA